MTGLPAALLTALVAAAAFLDGPWAAVRSGAGAFLMLALVAFAALGSGRRLVAALGAKLDEAELSVAGMTVGLGILALAVFALAAAGILRPWTLAALTAALIAIGYFDARAGTLELFSTGRKACAEHQGFALLIGLPMAFALWACLAPPHQYDSLVYHLALPQEYLRAGKLFVPPGILFAHFPQNGEMLFSLALGFGSDNLAQMLSWLATALTLGWLLTFGRRVSSAAPWAAAIVATHTSILLLASISYVEPFVMLWLTAAVLAFEASGEGRRRGELLLAALCAGFALGTKYYAGLACALLALRLLRRGKILETVIFSAIVTALFLPWLVKNWIFIGNPVFPFFYRYFPATSIGWTSDLAAGYFSVLTEYGHAHGFWKDLVSLPVLLFRNPLRFGGGMDVLGDLGWDLTLWLWGWGLWRAARSGGRHVPGALAAFSVLYVLGWFATGVVLRFLTALVPVMALIGAAGFADWRRAASPAARGICAAAFAALVLAHAFMTLYVHGVFGTYSTLLALETREEFLSIAWIIIRARRTRRAPFRPTAAFCWRANSAAIISTSITAPVPFTPRIFIFPKPTPRRRPRNIRPSCAPTASPTFCLSRAKTRA